MCVCGTIQDVRADLSIISPHPGHMSKSLSTRVGTKLEQVVSLQLVHMGAACRALASRLTLQKGRGSRVRLNRNTKPRGLKGGQANYKDL